MANIVVTAGIPQSWLTPLSGHQVILPAPKTGMKPEELALHLPEADAIIAIGPLNGDQIRMAKKARIIANYGAGYDKVDIQAAAEMGIPVTNLTDSTAEATAELAFGLMLDVTRRISETNLRFRQEPSRPIFGMGASTGRTLRGQTLGLIGVGYIGKCMARMAKAFGMHVIGYSRRGADPAVCTPVSLEELLSTSDVVSLHCPLTPETENLMNRDRIFSMKQGAILINTARGPVVDNQALAEAVAQGHLRGAGLDVFPHEPEIPAAYLPLSTVVMTPHIGTDAADIRQEMAHVCCSQVLDALQGKRPAHIVNGL